MEELGTAVFFGLMMVYGIFIRAACFTVCWSWFVVTRFNLPVLTIAQAAGLLVVISLLTPSKPLKKKPGESFTGIMWEATVDTTIAVLMTLGIGWVITLFL